MYLTLTAMVCVEFQQVQYINLSELIPGRGGGYLRNFWVGMCRWAPGTLNLYQS